MDQAWQDAGDVRPLAKERAHFSLRTLGGLTLLGPDGREVASLATRRRRLAVLAWLAMRPLPPTRDQVVGGEHRVTLRNAGWQAHLVLVTRLAPEKTSRDVMAWLGDSEQHAPGEVVVATRRSSREGIQS